MPLTTRKPRVLVVDDDRRTLNMRKEQLEEWNLDVVLAETTEAALTEIEASPEMDAVLTDISMKPNDSKDFSGVEMAQTVKSRYGAIPLFAYSAKVDERELLRRSEGLFVSSFPKGLKDRDEMRDIAGQIRDASFRRRQDRREESADTLEALLTRHRLEKIDSAETVRRLLPHARSSADIEANLKAAGYHLELVHSSIFTAAANPLLVWVKETDGEAEAEVYGQSILYAHGASGDEAIDKLIELMRGFAKDFASGEGTDVGPSLRLREFLERTMLSDGGD
jgi:CheY-like chemotaxis protein